MEPKVEPPCSDEAVKAKTGRDWADWCAVLDSSGARELSHPEIVRVVDTMHDAGGWWSQMVTVGYERLRGLRLTGQRRAGAFGASKSKTLPVAAETVHPCFTDPEKRRRWLDEDVEIRTATAPKSVRMTWPDGTGVEVWITTKGEAKCSVAIEHTKLDSPDAVAEKKEFWGTALGRLAAELARSSET